MDSDRSAAEVFRLLSDETRLDVLRTVAEAQAEQQRSGVPNLSFSDIYERVDVDNTSKLSYHLGELTGVFLRKHDEGYAFTHAGDQLVRFVLSGNFESPPDVEPIETSGACLHCDERGLEARIRDQFFVISCRSCGQPAFSYRVRPAQVRSHDGQNLIDAVVGEQAGDFRKIQRGVCPDCAGRVETEVIDVADVDAPEDLGVSYATISSCAECMRFYSRPLTHAAAFHPESVTFHWDHGVDILGTGMWELHRHLQDGTWHAEQVDDDPETYRVELAHESAVLRLFLDGSASVTRSERVRRSDQPDRRS